jgi:hypothetical protein
MKLQFRKLTNAIVRCLPTVILRYALKSVMFQPKVQDKLRLHVGPYHFYSPMVSPEDLVQPDAARKLRCFDPDFDRYAELIRTLSPYAAELVSYPADKSGDYWFDRKWYYQRYEDWDAVFLYSMIRHLKPRRIVEIGSGCSSWLISMASRKNENTECLFIEPYPSEELLRLKLNGKLLTKKIQEVDASVFTSLEPGDVMFVDSSHVLKTQSDLVHILNNLLPGVRSGVYIHFHDICTPFDYPAEILLEWRQSWNEQYALEAILCNSDDYEIVLPGYWLWKEHRDKIRPLLPNGERRAVSFWVKKR